jgi:site-specific recombinase XerD
MFSTDREKSPKTIHDDIYRGGLLIARFERETKSKITEDSNKFEVWISAQKQTWCKSTWRRYKAALVEWCRSESLSQLQSLIQKTSNKGCKNDDGPIPAKERKTSAKRKKKVTPDELAKIVQKYKETPDGHYWVKAGVEIFLTIYFTGMRRCELEHAVTTIHKGKEALKIKNGKYDKERAHGEYRHLTINHFPESIKSIIRTRLSCSKQPKNAHGEKISHDYFMHQAGVAFSNFTKKLFPKRYQNITLYTGRHQYAANAKASGKDLATVAAEMGHSSDRTPACHYGKRRSGSLGIPLPIADPHEVARVRRKHRTFSNDLLQPQKNMAKNPNTTSMRPR